jgi:hypothetical protein
MYAVPLQLVRQINDGDSLERALVYAYPTSDTQRLRDNRLLYLLVNPHHLSTSVNWAVLDTFVAAFPWLTSITINYRDSDHAVDIDGIKKLS